MEEHDNSPLDERIIAEILDPANRVIIRPVAKQSKKE